MYLEHINLKEKIFFEVLNFEKKSRRGVSDIAAQSGISEYYLLFKNLYYDSRELFAKALIELSDTQDSTYEYLNENKDPYFCRERIIINILRIRICFDIETEDIRNLLRKLLCVAVDKNRDKDFEKSHIGFLLYHDILRFFSESIGMIINKPARQFFEDKVKIKTLLTDFVTIDDVKNIETAILYKELYNSKMVSCFPSHIRQTVRLCCVFDTNLVTVDVWEKYFYKYSSARIDKDILLFKKIGFVEIPNVIEKIRNTIEATACSSKAQKKCVCTKVIKRFRSSIEQAMSMEPFKLTVDKFLSNFSN